MGSLLFTSCNDTNENLNTKTEQHQANAKINNSKKTEDVIKFETAFKNFNKNVKEKGQQEAENIIKQEAISYLTYNSISFSSDSKPEELVILVFNHMTSQKQ